MDGWRAINKMYDLAIQNERKKHYNFWAKTALVDCVGGEEL